MRTFLYYSQSISLGFGLHVLLYSLYGLFKSIVNFSSIDMFFDEWVSHIRIFTNQGMLLWFVLSIFFVGVLYLYRNKQDSGVKETFLE